MYWESSSADLTRCRCGPRPLADLRESHRRLIGEGYRIEWVVNDGSAIGCYFFDPEGNVTELFWPTGYDCWNPTCEPIDLADSDEAIAAALAGDRARVGRPDGWGPRASRTPGLAVRQRPGLRSAQGRSVSSADAARSTRASSRRRPTICRPTGRPLSVQPAGRETAGWPL